MNLREMYVTERKSIPAISSETGMPKSTVRSRLKSLGVLRSRSDALKIAGQDGHLGSGVRGKTRVFSDEWKRNISIGKIKAFDGVAAGISKKRGGYIVYTRGQHKGRLVHVVKMEESIGRRLYANEVVHHIDENKQNNDPSNLQLMTRSEHAAFHATENAPRRTRKLNGQFE